MKLLVNLIVVGDGNVGKTAFIDRYATGDFNVGNTTRHMLGRNMVTTIEHKINIGKVAWSIRDCDLNDEAKEMYHGADCAILMFDVTDKKSYDNLETHYNRIRSVCPNIPIILCGNKVDVPDRAVTTGMIKFHKDYNLQYYDISCKSDYNYEKPFLYLIRTLVKSNDIWFA